MDKTKKELKPKWWERWLESRKKFIALIGWTPASFELSETQAVAEYRAMLVALKKECTCRGIATMLDSTEPTIRRDRKFLGVVAPQHGGRQRPMRLFNFDGRQLTCQEIADLEKCKYQTAYYRLTKGDWRCAAK